MYLLRLRQKTAHLICSRFSVASLVLYYYQLRGSGWIFLDLYAVALVSEKESNCVKRLRPGRRNTLEQNRSYFPPVERSLLSVKPSWIKRGFADFYYYLIKEQKDFGYFVGLYSVGSDLVFSQPVPLWGSHRWLYLIYFSLLWSLWTNNTLPDHCSRCWTRKRCQGNSCAVYSFAMYVYLSSRPGCLITTIKPYSQSYPSSLCAGELPLFNF